MPVCGFLLRLASACCRVVDAWRHPVDGVGALLDEVLHDAHALVVGLLEAGDGVLKLLDLGLQLHHVLADGEGRRGAEEHCGDKGGGDQPEGLRRDGV